MILITLLYILCISGLIAGITLALHIWYKRDHTSPDFRTWAHNMRPLMLLGCFLQLGAICGIVAYLTIAVFEHQGTCFLLKWTEIFMQGPEMFVWNHQKLSQPRLKKANLILKRPLVLKGANLVFGGGTLGRCKCRDNAKIVGIRITFFKE